MLWKDQREPTIKLCMGRQVDRTEDTIDGEPMEHEWNIFPGFTTLQLCNKVQELLSRLSVTPEKFIGRIIFMSMFNDIQWGSKDNKKCESNAQLVPLYARRFSPRKSSFFGLGLEKCYYTHEYEPQGEWDRVAEQMMEFLESGHPVFPCYESFVTKNTQKQWWWKIINTVLFRPGKG